MEGDQEKKNQDIDQQLEELMEEYGQDVWNLALFLSQNSQSADDITQDVFLRVYQKLHTFKGDSSIKTWLLSITRNVAYDYRRSAFVKKVSLIGYILDLVDKQISPSAENEAIDLIITDSVWKKALSLPVKLSEVLILYAYHQLSIAEIADVLGIAEGTVKSRLHRARMKMSKMLEGDADE